MQFFTLLLASWTVLALSKGIVAHDFHASGVAGVPKPVKAITTPGGDVFDCVEMENQIGLNHPLLKGHKIQNARNPMSGKLPKLDATMLSSFNAIDCPMGTVPQKREPSDGVDKSSFFHQPELFDSPTVEKTSIKFSRRGKVQIVDAGKFLNVNTKGVITFIEIWKPIVENAKSEFSASFFTIESGNDSIRVGWMVNPGVYGDNNPRFTIANSASFTCKLVRNDAFKSEPCYNTACGFVVVNNTIGLGDRFALTSTSSNRKYIAAYVVPDEDLKAWVLVVNLDIVVGYWPFSLFKNMKQGVAKKVTWRGRIANSYPNRRFTRTRMGNGFLAKDPKAAKFTNLFYLDLNLNPIVAKPRGFARSKCYTLSSNFVDGIGNTGFYFGGSGFATGLNCAPSRR